MKISEFLILIFVAIFFAIVFDACTDSVDNALSGEKTILYSVEKYKVHDAGVEIWARSYDGEQKGFFVEHEKVFAYEDPEEEMSRVVALYCLNECECLRNAYLYFSIPEFKEYIKEMYDIE